MVGATAVALMIIDNSLLLLPTLLVAFTVKVKVFTIVGVPEIIPSVESVNPVGKLPLSNDHIIGVVPVAASC
jgi:hypothetical protein